MEENQIRLNKIRHTASHILAMAVLKIQPGAKLAIGPTIDNGFYYDFELTKPISEQDFPALEKIMAEIIKSNLPIENKSVGRNLAIKQERERKQPYKVELIEGLEDDEVSYYGIGNFWDLCKGPHTEKTGDIKAFKLMSIAGAYWRGDEKNNMLTRIYGTAFESKEDLKKYEDLLAEAQKRDHKKLGKELGLLVFSDLIGAGLPIFTAKGNIVRSLIQNYSSELRKEIGYKEVHTPQMNRAELFKISGHLEKYVDSMFKVESNYTKEAFYLKPMNCPQHTQIYASELRSYKDLPIRIADFAVLYRDEKPGEINGLLRLRGFAQDDGHCFCREDQIAEEIKNLLVSIKKAMDKYGMDYYMRLSLRDKENQEKYIGEETTWDDSEKILEDLLTKEKINFIRGEGEAAFYGPKIDLIAKDSMGREWQLSTIQLDFNMPSRFKLDYIDETGKKKTPIMIHSALVGSPDRFMGVLIEHYAGAFPFWLAPIQVVVIPLSERFVEYAQEVNSELINSDIRSEVDITNETLGKRIRHAEMQKIPFIIIVGQKELDNKTLTIRERGKTEQSEISVEEFVKILEK